jgi:hypothetical protein
LFPMLTGPKFKEEHVLDDGTHVTLRHIRPDDAGALKRGFEQLSQRSRYQRFGGAIVALTHNQLRYLTNVDGKDHVAIVATTLASSSSSSSSSSSPSDEVGLGIGRFVRNSKDPSTADVALTVVDELQHKGLGRILAIALGRAALERGIHRFQGQALADNETVRNLLDEMGASVHTLPGNELTFEVDLDR